jgi:hypothetical protein
MIPQPINRDQIASQFSPPNTPPNTPSTSPAPSPPPSPPTLTRQVGYYYLLNQPLGTGILENTNHRTPEQQRQIDYLRASNPGVPEYIWWPNEDFQYNREYLRSLIPASEFGPPPSLTRTLSDHSYGASEPSDYDDG